MRNKTLQLTEEQINEYEKALYSLPQGEAIKAEAVQNRIICGDMLTVVPKLPKGFADLIFFDPPYNMNKRFEDSAFHRQSDEEYAAQLQQWLSCLLPTLRENGTIYICGDWRSSTAIYTVARGLGLTINNRITWEREKGRGSKRNWKNASEDIWFCTKGEEFYFNAEAVKLKRKVLAPYRNEGEPKDWCEDAQGAYRLTYPSNLWTDITVPFWSMPENTDHPTQKPEKLLAKLILASTKEGDTVLDATMGSGTAAVTAYKLSRNYVGIDTCKKYCCYALARLAAARTDKAIQGYVNGTFYERNTLAQIKKRK